MTDERDAVVPSVASRAINRVEQAGFHDFVDADYVHWRVTERDAGEEPGHHARWCLIFACPDAARRVWEYPVNWRTLSPTELVALSWGR